jgi:hypothetical protein
MSTKRAVGAPEDVVDNVLYLRLRNEWNALICTLKDAHFQAYTKTRSSEEFKRRNVKGPQVLAFDCNDRNLYCKLSGTDELHNESLPPNAVSFEIHVETYGVLNAAAQSETAAMKWMQSLMAHNAYYSSGVEKDGYAEHQLFKSDSKAEMQSAMISKYSIGPEDVSSYIEKMGLIRLTITEKSDDYNEVEKKCCNIKLGHAVRLLKILISFPFVLVVSTTSLTQRYPLLKSPFVIRFMNLMVYLLPCLIVFYLFKGTDSVLVQRVVMVVYVLLYLFPVAVVVAEKIWVGSSTYRIEESTFCFKPAKTFRHTLANYFMISGFVVDWFQMTLYVLPLGIFNERNSQPLALEDVPPWIPFRWYFWLSFSSVIICALTLILNSVLTGKVKYRWISKNWILWLFYFNIGGAYFVSVVTILFMGAVCDYSVEPPVLVQTPDIVCWESEHLVIASCSLFGLGVYLIQMTLLPSGTFKETMTDAALDIVFVPVYLQAHMLIKAIFSGIFVVFYNENALRVTLLTFLNILQLGLNLYMKPCSISVVNTYRDATFLTAVLSGLQSLNYIFWSETNEDSSAIYLSTLLTNMLVITVLVYVGQIYSKRPADYAIARAFLDLEWQVTRGGEVHPRVLEPLIALTLTEDPLEGEHDIAKKYVEQIVWLISYPNIRVQFQSSWALANIACFDEDARMRIHEAGGTKALLDWYAGSQPQVQLEILAAVTNLTLSPTIGKILAYKLECIPFFLSLIASNNNIHAHFGAIAIANLATDKSVRRLIISSGGITVLVGCFLTNDFHKKRAGCLALVNLTLEESTELLQVFSSRKLVENFIRYANRDEHDSRLEIVSLLYAMCCHSRLRPILIGCGILESIQHFQNTNVMEVIEWSSKIYRLLEVETGVVPGRLPFDGDLLKEIEPSKGSVTWNSWSSKLDFIFGPLFSTIPNLKGLHIPVMRNTPVDVCLSVGLSDEWMNSYAEHSCFKVVDHPLHGELSDITGDMVTYSPENGYQGMDFFSYVLLMGNLTSNKAIVALKIVGKMKKGGGRVEGYSSAEDLEHGGSSMRGAAGNVPGMFRGPSPGEEGRGASPRSPSSPSSRALSPASRAASSRAVLGAGAGAGAGARAGASSKRLNSPPSALRRAESTRVAGAGAGSGGGSGSGSGARTPALEIRQIYRPRSGKAPGVGGSSGGDALQPRYNTDMKDFKDIARRSMAPPPKGSGRSSGASGQPSHASHAQAQAQAQSNISGRNGGVKARKNSPAIATVNRSQPARTEPFRLGKSESSRNRNADIDSLI